MDIINDGSHSVLVSISDNYGLPEYVKKAEDIFTKEASDKLPVSLFADQVNRRYPIGSKADTWLSAAYFAKTAGEDGYSKAMKESVRLNIKAAAAAFGIAKDVDDIMERISTPVAEKRAEDDDLNYGDPSTKMYPMFDSYGVKLAGEHFADNRNNYPLDLRRRIARNIMRKSAELAVDVPDVVRREAGLGMPRLDFMSIQIIDRANRAPTEKMAEAMTNLNKGLMAATMSDLIPVLEKAAEAIAEFDQAVGLDLQYGRTVLAPADFLFDVSQKQAQDYAEDAVQLGKEIFSAVKLAELPEELYSETLGDDFLGRVKSAEGIDSSKLADELNSLPKPDQAALLDAIYAYPK